MYHARHHCSTFFLLLAHKRPRYQRRRLTPRRVGHWSSSKRPHPHLRTWSRQRSSCGPRTHQNPTNLGLLLHPLHQPATPNNDEHELHRRLRSQKASNRSFLRRHRNGREGLSHFGNAPHMQHMHTNHTQTLNTTANRRCWRRPDSTVSKLGYTTEGRKGGHLGGPAIESFLVFEGASRDGCLWEGNGLGRRPGTGTQSTGEIDLV